MATPDVRRLGEIRDRITTRVVGHLFRHRLDGTGDTVRHLEGALGAAVRVRGEVVLGVLQADEPWFGLGPDDGMPAGTGRVRLSGLLAAVVAHGADELRAVVFRLLGQVAVPQATEVMAALVDLARDPEAGREAAEVVRALGPAAPTEVLAALPGLLRNGNPEVRRAGVQAVGALGPAAPADAVGLLAGLLRDPDGWVRGAAAEVVRALGPAAPGGVLAAV